jgi:glucans biosynthesis protein C
MNKSGTEISQRRPELDWLRVILVLMVFFHHVAMPFNGDKWHIMNMQKSKLLDDIMVYFEQWRLPLLLLVSGAGTILAFSKRSAWQFVKERSRRLLIPLLFGAMVIIPPQTYFQFIDQYTSYFDLYPDAILKAKNNHLWFIEFLFVFSLVALPLILFLRSYKSIHFKQKLEKYFSGAYGLLTWVLPLIVLRLITKAYYPTDEGSITNLAKSLYYFYFYLAGIILFSCPVLWSNLKLHRKTNAIAALACTVLFYGYYYLPQEFIPASISIEVRWGIWWVVASLVGWSTILAAIGYAQYYLSHSKPWLIYLNEAVYPFYILHQTVIVVLAFYIIKWDASIAVKLSSLAILSFAGIFILYRIVYSFKWLRFLFGMKSKRKMIS